MDRTFRDVLQVDQPFGGKLVVFTGDYKQCLPIIPGGGRTAVINATFKHSYLWNSMDKFSLTGYMRHDSNQQH